jgi:hypothetical protein
MVRAESTMAAETGSKSGMRLRIEWRRAGKVLRKNARSGEKVSREDRWERKETPHAKTNQGGPRGKDEAGRERIRKVSREDEPRGTKGKGRRWKRTNPKGLTRRRTKGNQGEPRQGGEAGRLRTKGSREGGPRRTKGKAERKRIGGAQTKPDQEGPRRCKERVGLSVGSG